VRWVFRFQPRHRPILRKLTGIPQHQLVRIHADLDGSSGRVVLVEDRVSHIDVRIAEHLFDELLSVDDKRVRDARFIRVAHLVLCSRRDGVRTAHGAHRAQRAKSRYRRSLAFAYSGLYADRRLRRGRAAFSGVSNGVLAASILASPQPVGHVRPTVASDAQIS